jgi:hypothetical protein
MTAPRTTEAVRPVAGASFRYCARLDVGGQKRRKLIALVGAYRDGGVNVVSTAELAKRLDWPWVQADTIARRLHDDGFLERAKRKRWRLAAHHAAEVEPAQKAPER